MTEQVNFTADISFLCQLLIQREYEKMTENNDYEYKYINYYPIWEVFKKQKAEGFDFEEDLSNFLVNIMQMDKKKTVVLTVEILEVYVSYWIKRTMKSPEYEEEKARRERKIEIKHKEADFNEFCRRGVFNRETGNSVSVNFGEHWGAVMDMVEEKFGKDAVFKKDIWPEIDLWIARNIVLKGEFNNPDHYRIKNIMM